MDAPHIAAMTPGSLVLGVGQGDDDDGYSSPPSPDGSPGPSPSPSPRGGRAVSGDCTGDAGPAPGGGWTSSARGVQSATYWPYGFQLRASYGHGKRKPDIMAVTYNGRTRQFVMLDSKGITTWSKENVAHTVQRTLSYPKYQYRLITYLIYVRKYNVYFVLSHDFAVKVLNSDFEETCRISAGLRSVLFMLFNPVKDELITGGVGGTKVWRYHQVADKSWREIKPMANYKLTLKYELKQVGGSWVKRVELDLEQQHLYCCADTDLYAYDMEGNSLFTLKSAHVMSITGCVYSHHARHLVTASVDREVKVWSVAGGLVHTFRGHSQAVTDLTLHPEDASLVLTSSLDGTVRMWSLDTMELIYSLVVSAEGVHWMGFTDDNLLYLCTARHLSVWSLNTNTVFWGLARCRVTSLQLVPGRAGKSTRVVAIGEDSSVRILSRASRKSVSMVMPPPPISPLSRIRDVAHVRDVNVSYVLIDTCYLWLYTNRSDPACRMAIWDMLDIQAKLVEPGKSRKQHRQEEGRDGRLADASLGTPSGPQRATLVGTGNETAAECRCVCYLNSPVIVLTEQGICCPIQLRYLLVGLEDGRILFMDLLMKGKRYMEFRANKDAICHMEHDEVHSCLVTRCNLGNACLLQLWDLPSLSLLYELHVPPDVTAFARLGESFLTGHLSGAVLLHKLVPVQDGSSNTNHKATQRPGLSTTFTSNDTSGHIEAVTSLDVCHRLRLFLSASTDGMLKVWNENKLQVSEVQLDKSLTSACFLNEFGDVIVAFKNHIFLINRTKVSAQSIASDGELEDDGEESDQYEDTSMLTDLGESSKPIDMTDYLVPYKTALGKELSPGGKYDGVETRPSLLKVTDVELSRMPSARADMCDSLVTPHGPKSPTDVTVPAGTTDLPPTDSDEVGKETLLDEQKPRMTTKERHRGLRENRRRVVTTGHSDHQDDVPGVEASDGSTSHSSRPASWDGSGDSEGDNSSWLSYSTGGRSTFDDLSWDSDEFYEDVSENEAESAGSSAASPRKDAVPPQTPPAGVEENEKEEEKEEKQEEKDTEKEEDNGRKPLKADDNKGRRRRKRFADNIRVDAAELLKAENQRRRALRRLQRHQADQAPGSGGDGGPHQEIREIKKKEKGAARRVGQHRQRPPPTDQSSAPTEGAARNQNVPEVGPDAVTSSTPGEEEKRRREAVEMEEKRLQLEREEQRQRIVEEERKAREEEEKKKREEEKKRKEQLKQEEERSRAQEEKKKQVAREPHEKDGSQRGRHTCQSRAQTGTEATVSDDIHPLPMSRGKQASAKRASSSKSRSALKSAKTATAARGRHKASSANHRRKQPTPVPGETAVLVSEVMVPPADKVGTKAVTRLTVEIPQVDVAEPEQVETRTSTADDGLQTETPPGLAASPNRADVALWLAGTADNTRPTTGNIPNGAGTSVTGDGRLASRPRSPGEYSDAGSEMTVPEVDIPLPVDRETPKDDDWWWRKSRRGRRSMTSTAMSFQRRMTPAEGARQRPHTASLVISDLTREELEKTYAETLRRYQGVPGTPDFVKKLHQNEGTRFEDNWHDRAIERHMLLKMQRHLRAQSANDKAHRIYKEQQDRRRSLVERKDPNERSMPDDVFFMPKAHPAAQRLPVTETTAHARAPGGLRAGSPGRAPSVRSMPSCRYGEPWARQSPAPATLPWPRPRPATAAGRLQLAGRSSPAEARRAERAEMAAEQPFRCSMTPPVHGVGKARSEAAVREEIDIRLLDPRNPVSAQFRARTGTSVPSKCSQYVLVAAPRPPPGQVKVMPTVLEQRLISRRFPRNQEDWIGHAKPPPSFRPPLLLYHPPAFTQDASC